MSDILDFAADYIEANTNATILQIRKEIQGQGSSHCEECGIQIPLARRTLLPNTRCCVDCAKYMEAVNKHHAKR